MTVCVCTGTKANDGVWTLRSAFAHRGAAHRDYNGVELDGAYIQLKELLH